MSGKTEIKLRALEPEDLEILYAWENNPKGWEISNTHLPWSKAVLKAYIKNAQQDIFTAGQIRLVVCKTDNTAVGLLDIFEFDPFHKRAGLGILIADSFRQQGLAKAALKQALIYGFKHLDLNQFFCHILEDNQASVLLFESLGFEKTGTKKAWIKHGNHYKNEAIYQLLRQDYLKNLQSA